MGMIFVIYGAIFLLILLICAWYLIQTLRAIRRLAETIQTLIPALDKQFQDILENVSTTTGDLKLTLSKVNDLIRTLISLPNFAANFGKQVLQSIFRK